MHAICFRNHTKFKKNLHFEWDYFFLLFTNLKSHFLFRSLTLHILINIKFLLPSLCDLLRFFSKIPNSKPFKDIKCILRKPLCQLQYMYWSISRKICRSTHLWLLLPTVRCRTTMEESISVIKRKRKKTKKITNCERRNKVDKRKIVIATANSLSVGKLIFKIKWRLKII